MAPGSPNSLRVASFLVLLVEVGWLRQAVQNRVVWAVFFMPTPSPQAVFKLPLAASKFSAQAHDLFLVASRMRFENILDDRFDRLRTRGEIAGDEALSLLKLQ